MSDPENERAKGIRRRLDEEDGDAEARRAFIATRTAKPDPRDAEIAKLREEVAQRWEEIARQWDLLHRVYLAAGMATTAPDHGTVVSLVRSDVYEPLRHALALKREEETRGGNMSDTLREQIAEILWEEIRRQHGRDVPAIAADRILALLQPDPRDAEIARLRAEDKRLLAYTDFLRAENDRLREALQDAMSGLRWIRAIHGDLYGVEWDRVEKKARRALAAEPEEEG
jgi:hypothetical protein